VDTIFTAGRQQPASRRTGRPLACYRVGGEGRISHLKRRYGLRCGRLRGEDGARTWVGWGVLVYLTKALLSGRITDLGMSVVW
jgi:transposase, IS5 family